MKPKHLPHPPTYTGIKATYYITNNKASNIEIMAEPHYLEKWLAKEKHCIPLDIRKWKGFHVTTVYHLVDGVWIVLTSLNPEVLQTSFVRIWDWVDKKYFYFQVLELKKDKCQVKPLKTHLEILTVQQHVLEPDKTRPHRT